jgi:hypothetical protein
MSATATTLHEKATLVFCLYVFSCICVFLRCEMSATATTLHEKATLVFCLYVFSCIYVFLRCQISTCIKTTKTKFSFLSLLVFPMYSSSVRCLRVLVKTNSTTLCSNTFHTYVHVYNTRPCQICHLFFMYGSTKAYLSRQKWC